MAVGWVVVRSLAGILVPDPLGADYLGGTCLLCVGTMIVRSARYSDRVQSGYVDINGREPFHARNLILVATVSGLFWGRVLSSLLLDQGLCALLLRRGASQSPPFQVLRLLPFRGGHQSQEVQSL